ncbi:glycine cleavage system aminomethyltransferase GcvT [Nakamurella endophytica]|uniref:Aminomethyltransferase n=1 Tax=Nakamurella endophytica TaxID=1748367 RepID=A0A917WIL4_9ACTN|nr:glycine cleavage system aminomethyltransferase GcvT [Nakamurella endophytica]GGM06604.1 aminomethyltransferase [Nakamurella endophytica]
MPATAPDDTEELLRSPLHAEHVALGATLGPFGGWLMPISYAGGGVVAEHIAVRTAVGLFDVSHLGKAELTGADAVDFANVMFTADLGRVGPGRAQYTLCCSESGGVVDDLIAYVGGSDEVFLVPNAANAEAVVDRLRQSAPAGVQVTDRHRDFGVLAVQGPAAADVLAAVGLPTELPYMGWADAAYAGAPVRVCRTGYTGERGYELLPAWEATPALWRALLEQVRLRGGLPVGLGARDTLRTEMGYPLHGQDLGPEITPVQARAGWAVGWAKAAFVGREALLEERAAGPRRLLRGVLLTDRGVVRPGMRVLTGSGDPVGVTTSGTFSPTLGRGIGLALLDTAAGLQDGDEVGIEVRGRTLRAVVQNPPFVPSHVR